MIKICKICGKQFETNTSRKICYDNHYKTCPECGKEVLWNTTYTFKGCKQCVQKAATQKRKQTMMERYGAPTTMQSKQLSRRMQQTLQERYGADNPMKCESIKQKVQATNMQRYGVKNPMSNPDIAKRSAQTRAENMDEIVQHIKEAWIRKYGVDNVSKCPEIIDKITDTFMKRYGVKRAIDVPEFRQKMIDTMIERYGVPWYVQSDEYRADDHFRISKINELFGDALNQHGIKFETEYRLEFYNYDFYIPECRTLVEIDPTYTHNIVGNHWNKDGVEKSYHSLKSKVAHDYNLQCIHVFDWDDWNKVINILKFRKTIYARNCNIIKVFPDITDKFLEETHLQGTCKGQDVCLGLTYDDKLVMVMTFGKPRYNKNYAAEILRFSTLPGYRVVGGASKLFRYFIKTFEINSIISYCDLSKFTGNVYEQIGMKYIRSTSPQEIWSKGAEKITANLLRQRGYDQLFGTNYGKGTSNDSLMLKNGWLPVYDCGQAVYAYGDTVEPIVSRKSVDIKPKSYVTKKCAFCGKEFTPKSNNQKYCKGPHYRKCPVCGKEYLEDNVENLKRPPVACSYECRSKLIRQTKSNNK